MSNNDGPSLDPHELENLTNATFGPLYNKLTEFNKKAAGQAWSYFKKMLGTVTELYFRKGMGERYYTSQVWLFGVITWGVSTIGYYALIREHYPGSFRAPATFIVGGLATLHYFWAGKKNFKFILGHRNEGREYHSRSRGISRFGPAEPFVALFALLPVIIAINPLWGLIFLVGYSRNLTLKAEQDEAIMSRYLDALDEALEKKYMKGAALGEEAITLSYLYNPLSEKWKPEVREKIASSLVGEPVIGVAKGPRRKGSPPDKGAGHIAFGKEAPEEFEFRRNPTEPEAISKGKQGLSEEEVLRLTRTGLRIRKLVFQGVALLAFTAIVFAGYHYLTRGSKSPAGSAAVVVQNPQPRLEAPVSNVATPVPVSYSPPSVTSVPQKTADADMVAQQRLADAQKAIEARQQQVQTAALESQKKKEVEIQELQAGLEAQFARFGEVQTNYASVYENNAARISKVTGTFGYFKRNSLRIDNDDLKAALGKNFSTVGLILSDTRTFFQDQMSSSRPNTAEMKNMLAQNAHMLKSLEDGLNVGVAEVEKKIAAAEAR